MQKHLFLIAQDLNPPELAAVLSSILAGESPPRPSDSAKYGPSEKVIKVFEKLEEDRDRLYYLQMGADMDCALGIDLRLAGTLHSP